METKTWQEVSDSDVDNFMPDNEEDLRLWAEFTKAALQGNYAGQDAASVGVRSVIRYRRLRARIKSQAYR